MQLLNWKKICLGKEVLPSSLLFFKPSLEISIFPWNTGSKNHTGSLQGSTGSIGFLSTNRDKNISLLTSLQIPCMNSAFIYSFHKICHWLLLIDSQNSRPSWDCRPPFHPTWAWCANPRSVPAFKLRTAPRFMLFLPWKVFTAPFHFSVPMHSDLTIISFGIQLETKDNILIHQMLPCQEAWFMLAVLRQTPQLAQSNKYRAEVALLTF